MLPAKAQPSDARANIATPARSTGLRPKRSDRGPMMICSKAVIPRYPAIDRFTSA